MEINDFLGIAIVGSALSFLIQYIKGKLGTKSLATKGITIGLAIILGAGYVFLRDTQWWTTIIGVLVAASTFYAFFLKK